MNVVDLCIILIAISGAIVGWHWGLIRQAVVSVGITAGLVATIVVSERILLMPGIPMPASALICVLATLFLFLGIDMMLTLGRILRQHIGRWQVLQKIDGFGGLLVGALTVLGLVWFMGPVLRTSPISVVHRQMNDSYFLTNFATVAPGAPLNVATLAHLLPGAQDPASRLFVGSEPRMTGDVPQTGDTATLKEAVAATEDGVVKVWGDACGKSSIGSGIVVADRLVATNAHVIAGVQKPQIESVANSHAAKVVWFDPEADIALLRTSGGVGDALEIDAAVQPNGTQAAIIGYPNGGKLAASSMSVTDFFAAKGYDIYRKKIVMRKMYALTGTVVPGNSGGPIVNQSGRVIALVVGHSLSQDGVGYAIAASEMTSPIAEVAADPDKMAVDTGSCLK